MNINNSTSLMSNIPKSSSVSSESLKRESSFKTLMKGKEVQGNDSKDKVSLQEKDNKKKVDEVLEKIDETLEKIENGSEEEIIEEVMVLLQSLNIPVINNDKLPVTIDLELNEKIEEAEFIQELHGIDLTNDILQALESEEAISENNIDKLLSYLSDKNGKEIKKEKFIEAVNLTSSEGNEDEAAGINMVKMVFNIENSNTEEGSAKDILSELLSLEDNELSGEATDDGLGYIAEEAAIFTDMLKHENAGNGNAVSESQAVTVSRETASADVVSNIKYMMKNEVQQLTVKIYPKELGEITIKLLSEDGIMKANIKSTSKETYMLLNSNMDEIKKYLSSENIAIKEVNIELYNEDTTYYSGEGFESQFQEEKDNSAYFVEDGKAIKIKEEKEDEVLNEISNVNLLA